MNNQLIKPMDFLNEAMPECNEEYPWTDLGDGKIFAHCYQNIVRYVPERENWYIYEDGIWKQDLGGLQTMEYCKIMACALQKYQESVHPYRLRVDYGDHCRVWQRRSKRETVLKEAKGILKTSIKNFDADPFVLNCLNGTLNLHTMKFSPHNSADLLTKMAEVRYEPGVKCERFEQFVTEIMSGDLEKARYLQKVMGYTLSGNTREECMFFLWGETTRNGKGTLCETVLKLMGSYGIGANPEVLAEPVHINSHGPSEDIARLAGVRYISMAEPRKGMLLNGAQIKQLTGNDTISARYLHENSFNFQMQGKIIVNTNYLPVINDQTLFSSGRIIIIPFNRHFKEWEQDKDLKVEFAKPENRTGILNWMIEGYRMYREEGLTPPLSVATATGLYQEDSDDIDHFVQENLIATPNGEVRTAQVYGCYRIWCEDNGLLPESSKVFNAQLRMIGTVTRKRPRNGGAMTTLLLGYQLIHKDNTPA
jgi:putative DNA primase/helicase